MSISLSLAIASKSGVSFVVAIQQLNVLFPVKFSDPSMVTLASLLQCSFILLMTANNWFYFSSSPRVFSFKDSTIKNFSFSSKLLLIPRTKIRSGAEFYVVTANTSSSRLFLRPLLASLVSLVSMLRGKVTADIVFLENRNSFWGNSR